MLTPAERRQIFALAISVDPRTDTPNRIHHFLLERGALGRLDYLIGSPQQLVATWKAFDILSAQETGNPSLHSAPVRIYDRHGIWVSSLHAGADLTAANLVHDLRQALRT